jgi:hypothetical protein
MRFRYSSGMSVTRVQVTLKTVDANPENFVTNSWAVFTGVPPINVAATVTSFKDFYDDINATYWSNAIAQNGHIVKFYALPGTPPNYPFAESTFNLAAAPTGVPLPSECAIVLSMQGTRTAGAPQARRRGRVYLGPWGSAANTTGRPTPALATQIASAVQTLNTNLEAQSPISRLNVWSQADGQGVEITDGWIDNAWDTQRRRGLQYTSRTTYVL